MSQQVKLRARDTFYYWGKVRTPGEIYFAATKQDASVHLHFNWAERIADEPQRKRTKRRSRKADSPDGDAGV